MAVSLSLILLRSCIIPGPAEQHIHVFHFASSTCALVKEKNNNYRSQFLIKPKPVVSKSTVSLQSSLQTQASR